MATAVQTQPNLPSTSSRVPSNTVPRPTSPASSSSSPDISPNHSNASSPTLSPRLELTPNSNSSSHLPAATVYRFKAREAPVKVIVVSDMNCPWCYVAFKSINNSIRQLSIDLLPQPAPRFEIEFRPYPLIASLGSDDVAVERMAFYAKKFGGERAKEVLAMIAKRGKEIGIDFKNGGLIRQSNRAHRLLHLAYRRGGMMMQQSLLAHLFKAYMEQEVDIGSPPILASYAEMVGLMPKEEAEEWIRGNEMEDEVKKLAQISSGCGITGVPFVVVDGKWAISGAQDDDTYYQVFSKLARGEMQ